VQVFFSQVEKGQFCARGTGIHAIAVVERSRRVGLRPLIYGWAANGFRGLASRKILQEISMRYRSLLGLSALSLLVLPLTSCLSSPALTSIVITPNAYTITLAPDGYGGYWSYAATGYYTHPGHVARTADITDQVTWTSLAPIMVTISSTGIATPTGLATGTSQITASAPGFHGLVVSNASTFTVQLPTTNTAARITTLSLVPSQNQEASFAVMGKTADGSTTSVTDHVTWSSSNPQAATIDKNTGAVKVIGAGKTTIAAIYTNADGGMAMGTKVLTVAP
jgi:Bacterial Ig-like domain (group 2)